MQLDDNYSVAHNRGVKKQVKQAGCSKLGTDNPFAVLQSNISLAGAGGPVAPISQPAPIVPAADMGSQASQPLSCSPPRLSSATDLLHLLESPITVGN